MSTTAARKLWPLSSGGTGEILGTHRGSGVSPRGRGRADLGLAAQMRLLGARKDRRTTVRVLAVAPSGEQGRPGRERGLVTQLLLTFPSPA